MGKSEKTIKGGLDRGDPHRLSMQKQKSVEQVMKDAAEQANALHFDTRQYSHIAWESEADLYTKLLNRIRATIV